MVRRGPAALLILFLAGGLYGAQERPATAIVREGLTKLEARQIEEARKAFRAVLGMPDADLTAWERAEAHRGLGQILNLEGRYADARKELDEALRLHLTTADRTALGYTYGALGFNEWGFGRSDNSRKQYELALAEFEAVGDSRQRATTLYSLTFVARSIEERLELLPRALQASRDVGDRRLEGKSLHNWSDTLFQAGDYRQAYDLLEQALVIFREEEARFELARALTSMARLYRAHDHNDHAIALYQQALESQQQLGDRQGVVQSLRSIGATHLESGDIGKARETYEKALAVADGTGSESVKSLVLVALGQALHASGEHQQAAMHLERAAATFGQKQNGTLNVSLANTYLALRRPADAEKAAADAIRLAPTYGNTEGLLGGHFARARALEELGNRDGAAANVQSALAVYEKLRANLLPADFLNRGYSEKSASLFQYGVRLMYRAGRPAEALAVAEQARARAFLDLLATRELQRRSASLPHPPGAGAGSPTKPLPPKHAAGESAQADVPDLRSLTSAASVTAEEYRAAAHRMTSTILTYWTDDQGLYIWVVPPEGEILLAHVNVTPDRLRELIRNTGASGSNGESRSGGEDLGRNRGTRVTVTAASSRSRAAWRELHRLLIEPVQKRLPEKEGSLVTIVPHGPLFRVAFAGLRDATGRYLVEDYRLNTVPSVALLRFNEKRLHAGPVAERRYLLISDPSLTPTGPSGTPLPPLPGARQEVAEIARVLGPGEVRSLSGREATETAVKAAMPDAQVVHLATHGILLDNQPFESFLALGSSPKMSDDGRLTAREIYDLRLNADLVVLSACSTALGQVTGDGIVGLTRAFFYAGAPSIVATLWDVTDEPTRHLMSEFYRAYLGGDTRSGALRAAQLRLLRRLREGRISVKTPLGVVTLPEDPRLWAGVVLLGEP